MPSRGFTLIELLVVIAIIGILSAVVLASLSTARVKGLDAQRESNLVNVQTALEEYYNTNGHYPTDSNWDSTCSAWAVTTQNNAIPGLSPNYMSQLPLDPQVNTSANICCYMYYSPDGINYKYMLYNCTTSLACYGSTEANSGALIDPIRTTYSCAVYSTPYAGANY
ncbi:MAG: type II secretion system protein [Minisyncoccia bacterium]